MTERVEVVFDRRVVGQGVNKTHALVHSLADTLHGEVVVVELGIDAPDADTRRLHMQVPRQVWDTIRAYAALQPRLRHVSLVQKFYSEGETWFGNGWASSIHMRGRDASSDQDHLFQMDAWRVPT